jgi:DNA-binding MarR family transcriptional regulator
MQGQGSSACQIAPAPIRCLRYRDANPPTVTDLAHAMVMDRSGLGHTLRPLERDGYIVLVQNKEDGRQRSVVLTEAGRKVHQKAKALWEKAQRRFVEVVGQDERTSLHAKLLAIAHNELLTRAVD